MDEYWPENSLKTRAASDFVKKYKIAQNTKKRAGFSKFIQSLCSGSFIPVLPSTDDNF